MEAIDKERKKRTKETIIQRRREKREATIKRIKKKDGVQERKR